MISKSARTMEMNVDPWQLLITKFYIKGTNNECVDIKYVLIESNPC